MKEDRKVIEKIKIELRRAMRLAAEREEYESAAGMKRVLDIAEDLQKIIKNEN